jgi:hypothetical protein
LRQGCTQLSEHRFTKFQATTPRHTFFLLLLLGALSGLEPLAIEMYLPGLYGDREGFFDFAAVGRLSWRLMSSTLSKQVRNNNLTKRWFVYFGGVDY